MKIRSFLAAAVAAVLSVSIPEAAFARNTAASSMPENSQEEAAAMLYDAGGEGADDLVSLYERARQSALQEDPEAKPDGDDLAGAAARTAQYLYRLYNPNSGEHFYTASSDEKTYLVSLGWQDENYAWAIYAEGDTPVYRLYNPNSGDHHYTLSEDEIAFDVKAGWKYEGIAWYAAEKEETGVPVYRLYNPNAFTGTHHYTVSADERDSLTEAGWKYEGVAWYAVNPEDDDDNDDETKIAFGTDGATYSIQATVALNGTRVRADGGCIAKVVMPVSGDSAESFDVAYDYGMNNAEHTYFYLENIMSNAAEPGLKGKSYIRLQEIPYTAGEEVSIRLSWFEDEHKLEGYVNDVKVCETSTPNGTPSGFMLEAGGKYNGDTVDAQFTDIVINRKGTITSYPPFGSNCYREAYNGMSSAFTDTGCSITGTIDIPDQYNWDTIMSYNGRATSGYCIIGR